MMGRLQRMSVAILIGLAPVGGDGLWAQAEPAGGEATKRPVYVVREYLLKELVPSRVKGYMPMTRTSFEEKLEALKRVTAEDAISSARLVSGIYYARYDNNQLVDGRAGVEVVNQQATTSVLSLAPCRLPIRQLRWADPEDAAVSGGVGAANEQVVLVNRSSRLLFNWSLRGDDNGTAPGAAALTRFAVAIPPSSINQLVLDLPQGLVPVVADGNAQLADEATVDAAVVPAEVGEGLARWLVTLGGKHEFTLEILAPQMSSSADAAMTRLRQATRYRLSTAAVEVQTELSLAVGQHPIDRLLLESAPGLRVARVRIGERELLPGQITRGDAPGEIVLTFDTPLQGATRKLMIDAMAPLAIDQSVQLPSVRAPGLAWEQATATVEVPETLVLKQLQFDEAVQTGVASRAERDDGTLHQFQLLSPLAACSVEVGRPPVKTIVTTGTAVSVSPTQMTAQITADVRALEGAIHVLEAQVVAPWKVDTVEASPADALHGTPARRTRGRQIRVQLKEPVSGDRSVRLIITARRSTPAGADEIFPEAFRIVNFPDVADHRRLVSLRAEAPYHLLVIGEQPTADELGAFSEADRDLLGPLTSDIEYVDNHTNSTFRVSLTQEKPRYAGEIVVEAMADADVLRQAIRIQCTPESSPVSSLVVRVSPRPTVPLNWSTDESEGLLSARVVKSPDTDQASTWELQLRQPRTKPFQITAVCSAPLTETAPVFLASLIEASEQNGNVTIGAIDGTTVTVDADNLTAVPIPRPADGNYTFQRAAFRYDPGREHAVRVSRTGPPGKAALAWVWACELVSQFETHGAASHQIRFKIQNAGRPQVKLTLPATAILHRVLVNGSDASYARTSGASAGITVPLPPRERFPLVQVDYSTREAPLRDFTSHAVEWPLIDVPCLNRLWDIWLPPGISAKEDARFVRTTLSPSINWKERFFGRTLLRRDRAPFDLFSLADWQAIGHSARRDRERRAGQFLARFDRILTAADSPDASNEPVTWGQVLARYSRLDGEYTQPSGLRIDRDALRDQGITADALYPEDPQGSAADVFADHQLVLVAGPHSLLLTSRTRLGDFADSLQMTGNPIVLVASRGVRTAPSTNLDIVTPHNWLQTPKLSSGPWLGVAEGASEDLGVGWQHYRLRPNAAQVVRFSVYRPAVLQAVGWGAACVMIAVVIWFATRRFNLMALILIAVLCTLLMPAELIPVARGLLWGGLVGLLLSFLRATAVSPPPRQQAPSARNSAVLTGASVVLFVVLGAWQAFGDDQAPTANSTLATVYRVLIPVDEERKPLGEFVQVPQKLFDSLHRGTTTNGDHRVTWLIRSASYETSLALRGDGAGLVETDVIGDFELETFQMGTTVVFPLGRDAVRSFTNVRLDGLPIEPVWDPTGQALTIRIARPGRHRFEVALRPVLRNDDQSSGFSLSIPAHAGARLKVRSSSRIDGIQVPSVIGAIEQDAGLGTIEADLGPTDVLAVRWPLRSSTAVEKPPLSVAENFWLRINPSSVVLEGQFSFSVPRGGIDQIRLLVDPRLKLSQLAPSQPGNYETEGGPNPSIVVRFEDPMANQVLVRATFLMTETSGLGNIYLPYLRAEADVASPAAVGVSFPADFAVEVDAEPPLPAILPTEFIAAWQDADDAPQLAYRLVDREGRWHVTSRPRRRRPGAQQLATWSIGASYVELDYAASIDPAGNPCFQQQIVVSPRLEVGDLQVMQGETVYPATWTRTDDLLTVFFAPPVDDAYRLAIHGTARTGVQRRTALPLLSLRDVEFQSDRIVVRQLADVELADVRTTGLVDEASDASERFEASGQAGRLYKSYFVPAATEDSPAAAVSFLAKRNRPQVTGQIVTQLTFGNNDRLVSESQVALTVKAGSVEEIRLAVPGGWSGPLTITPPTAYEIQGTGDTRVMVIRRGRPTRKQINLRVRCESLDSDTSSSEVPLLRLLNENQARHYLILPGKRNDELISWETTGLKQIPKLPNQGGLPDEATLYEVEGGRVTAVVHHVGRLGGTPQVQLADIHVAWNDDRTYYGVGSFDIIPRQLTEVMLIVPSRLEIAHVEVAGIPVTLRTESGTRHWVPLGPDQLPQRVDVVFSGSSQSGSPRFGETILAPTLADLPVEQTLWTIHCPVGSVLKETLLEHTLSTAEEQATARAESASVALQMGERLTPHAAEAGFDSWTRSWKRRQASAIRIASGGQQTAPPEADAGLLDLVARHQRRLLEGQGEPVRFVIQGASSAVNLRFSDAMQNDVGLRLGLGFALIGLFAIANVALRRWRLRETLEQSWFALGVTAGIAWWLWFTPSFVGLMLVILFTTAAFWPVRKSHQVSR